MSGIQKKFNTFTGVFTPSVLTILGVIMYMRLGWVVGQSGLIASIAIILIAHIISLSTGLSISSIATDKKIKTGGIYYMLSRSLGLPMGGAIGITLFIGTALSISLYIIGFCESFLGIEGIRNVLGMDLSVDSFRILGTIVILILVAIAFISTSLALKTQFFILLAIGLSLISIGVGIFTGSEFTALSPSIAPYRDHLPFEVIFAIFFPAVTGFTAGVAMSGDLKDPKKSIPLGTMLSIFVGLVIYIGLAIAFAYFVDRDLMLQDNNFLLKIAWFSPFLVAGIWGATLSSSLGGILGGPRILQAISQDKITPKIFAKGHGQNNEPRNALIFTFLLAEIGILIGELDVIARIVSMFYIAAYGFINLAYALESWASSDFRPSFKIPVWVGIVGFFASIIVMFRIDILAMTIALIFLGFIFFLLKRREIRLEYGDVWQSVRASILRTVLHKMDRSGLEERNWKPNIMLFSGSSNSRPHLLYFGKQLTGKQGFISNFELIEGRKNLLFPKHQQSQKPDEESDLEGVFTRKHSCDNIYDGIEAISTTYGFAGVEPNTVLMGWGRQSKEPIRFVQMLNKLTNLDLNILMVDYDKKRQFGNYQQIDIWWRGTGNNGNLALTLVKFLLASPDWRNARLRLLIINPINEDRDHILEKANLILNNLRLTAEIKIINNQIENKSFYEIVEIESTSSDLIYMGIPEIQEGSEKDFIRETNLLCKKIGTVILLKASSTHKELNIGLKEGKRVKKSQIPDTVASLRTEVPDIIQIGINPLDESLSNLDKALQSKQEKAHPMFFGSYLRNYEDTFAQISQLTKKSLHYLHQKYTSSASDINKSFLRRFHANMLGKISQIIDQQEQLQNYKTDFSKALKSLLESSQSLTEFFPETINFYYSKDDFKILEEDSKWQRVHKKWRSSVVARKLIAYKGKMHPRAIVAEKMPSIYYETLAKNFNKYGFVNVQIILETRKAIRTISELFVKAYLSDEEEVMDISLINKRTEEILENLKTLVQKAEHDYYAMCFADQREMINNIALSFQGFNPDKNIQEKEGPSDEKTIYESLIHIPEIWAENQSILLKTSILETQILLIKVRLNELFGQLNTRLSALFDKHALQMLNELKQELKIGNEQNLKEHHYSLSYNLPLITNENLSMQAQALIDKTIARAHQIIKDIPETILLFENKSFNSFDKNQFDGIESIKVAVYRLIEYIIQRELIEPSQKLASKTPEKINYFRQEARDIINLIKFSTESIENDVQAYSNNHLMFFDGIKKINELIEEAREYYNNIDLTTREKLNTIDSRLTSYALSDKSASGLQEYIRQQESKKKYIFFSSLNESVNKTVKHQVNQFWYRQSKGRLLGKRLQQKSAAQGTQISNILSLTENMSPSIKVQKELPYYYQQLFLKKNHYIEEFWIGREKEFLQAQKTLERYKNGFKGAMLIEGDFNSGKSFFARHFCNNHFSDNTIFIVKAPLAGSTKLADFRMALEEATALQGEPAAILQQLPAGCAIILEDIELWWEKAPNQNILIERILQLIGDFSFKCFFIVSCHKLPYKLINLMNNADQYFIGQISLNPFNAEELHQAIIRRHKSGHLKFTMNGKTEENFRTWDYARYFTKLFNITGGNIGQSLFHWIACFTDYQSGRIIMQEPKQLDINKIENIELDWYLLISQFMLHKHMDMDKIIRVMRGKQNQREEYRKQLNAMKRAGILEVLGKKENDEIIYTLNQYSYPALANILKEKEII